MAEPERNLAIKLVCGCARCGGDHVSVVTRKLTRPVAPEDVPWLLWTHWFPCPTNGEPVLVRVTADA